MSGSRIDPSRPSVAAANESGPGKNLAEQRTAWLAQFPKDAVQLWRWCLEQDQQTLLSLLAFCVAVSVNAVQGKGESAAHMRLQHMSKWFGRLPRT